MRLQELERHIDRQRILVHDSDSMREREERLSRLDSIEHTATTSSAVQKKAVSIKIASKDHPAAAISVLPEFSDHDESGDDMFPEAKKLKVALKNSGGNPVEQHQKFSELVHASAKSITLILSKLEDIKSVNSTEADNVKSILAESQTLFDAHCRSFKTKDLLTLYNSFKIIRGDDLKIIKADTDLKSLRNTALSLFEQLQMNVEREGTTRKKFNAELVRINKLIAEATKASSHATPDKKTALKATKVKLEIATPSEVSAASGSSEPEKSAGGGSRIKSFRVNSKDSGLPPSGIKGKQAAAEAQDGLAGGKVS